jgi:hypothetical protein
MEDVDDTDSTAALFARHSGRRLSGGEWEVAEEHRDDDVLERLTQVEVHALRNELPDTRTDLCSAQSSVMNNSILLADALNGRHLSVVFIRSSVEVDWQISFNPMTGEPTGGYLLAMLNAISIGAGFTYTLTTHWREPNRTWTEELIRMAASHDLVLNWWTNTVERAELHFLRTFGFLDTSPQLVGRKQNEKATFQMQDAFSWTEPFETRVWITLLATCIFTGLAYLLVEVETDSDDLGDGSFFTKVLNAIYIGFLTVSGGGGFTPSTWPGKIIVVSWAWLVLLMISTYTANLATFLIVSGQSTTRYKNLHEAIGDNARICMEWGGSTWYLMRQRHPHYHNFIRADNVYEAMDAGDCDCAVDPSFSVDFAQISRHENPECLLEKLGGRLSITFGGWMVLANDDKCTGLIEQAFQVTFMRLERDSDQIHSIYRTTREKATTQNCADQNASETPQFSIFSMAGMLMVHAAFSFLALGVAGVDKIRKKQQMAKAADTAAEGATVGMNGASQEQGSGIQESPMPTKTKDSTRELLQHLKQALELAQQANDANNPSDRLGAIIVEEEIAV